MGSAAVLSRRDIRGMFFKRLEEAAMASWAPQIGHMFTSDQDAETYKFLGNVPALRAWRGARRKSEPKNFEIRVQNDKFEGTQEFEVDDMRRDKTDQIQARIGDLAARAAILPQKTFTTLLEANGLGYDGIAYFGAHTGRGSLVTNVLTDSGVADAGVPTSAEMSAGILTLIQTILGANDDQGEPMNEFAKAFLLMVPTKYWSATQAALKNEFTSAGVSNTLPAAGMTIIPIVNPRLVVPATGGTGVFYGFRIDSDIKPMIWQDEVQTQLQVLGAGSDHEFWYDSHVFGAKRVGNGALGAYEMAARMTFS